MSAVEIVYMVRASVCHHMPDRGTTDTRCGLNYRVRGRDTMTRAVQLVTCPDCLRHLAETAAERPGTLCGCNRAGACEHCARIGQYLP